MKLIICILMLGLSFSTFSNPPVESDFPEEVVILFAMGASALLVNALVQAYEKGGMERVVGNLLYLSVLYGIYWGMGW